VRKAEAGSWEGRELGEAIQGQVDLENMALHAYLPDPRQEVGRHLLRRHQAQESPAGIGVGQGELGADLGAVFQKDPLHAATLDQDAPDGR
jgi:hypothetical protein